MFEYYQNLEHLLMSWRSRLPRSSPYHFSLVLVLFDCIRGGPKLGRTRQDPLAKRVNRVGLPAHKRVVFGFRVATRLANHVGFKLAGQPEPDTPTRFANPKFVI
jgi:hypothetical protein